MKPESLRAERPNISQVNKPGLGVHAIRYIAWRLRTALKKGYLRLQDWTGLYGYQQWSRFSSKALEKYSTDAPDIFFSLIIKVESSRLDLVRDTCESLINQTHHKWEAFLVAEDPDAQVKPATSFQEEPRIHWLLHTHSLLWKGALNECAGDWVVYLNAGDTLPSYALAHIAAHIQKNPAASIIYSDMDCQTVNGPIYYNPSFWPDWSPELLLSVNYLRPAYVRRGDLLKAAELTPDYEEALLRCVESGEMILHVPEVLYHQRDMQACPWVEETFKPNALMAHLARQGLHEISSQTSNASCSLQLTWSFDQPPISIIILTRDNAHLLKRCLESIFKYTPYPYYEILLVENNSRDKDTFDYYQQLQSNSRVKLLTHNLPFNYSAFNNWATRQSSGELLLFLNNDIQCTEPGWLEELARWAIRNEIGIVGAKLLYMTGTIQHAGLVVGLEGHANHIFSGKNEGYCGLFGTDEWYRNYSAVTGACMMVRRDVFDQVGGFDEGYALAFNDIELCQRVIRAGYRVVYTPFSRLFHQEGATRFYTKPSGDIRLAYQHLKPLIEAGDPYYNPNLSTALRVPTLRRPWELPAIQHLDRILEFEG